LLLVRQATESPLPSSGVRNVATVLRGVISRRPRVRRRPGAGIDSRQQRLLEVKAVDQSLNSETVRGGSSSVPSPGQTVGA